MIPRVLVGEAAVPGGPPLTLFRHDGDFTIAVERNDLMSSRMGGSEIALGEMTCARLPHRTDRRLLIGGYGMGFTLRAVLQALGPETGDKKTDIVVAELVPEIIAWARGPMHALTAGCLDDPRVTVQLTDVGALIAAPSIGYDAIMLDVDNGPDGLTRPGNDALYSAMGLARATAALRPGGILAVWSAAPDEAFARRLAQAGLMVEEVRVKARTNGKGVGKGPLHVIWFAAAKP